MSAKKMASAGSAKQTPSSANQGEPDPFAMDEDPFAMDEDLDGDANGGTKQHEETCSNGAL